MTQTAPTKDGEVIPDFLKRETAKAAPALTTAPAPQTKAEKPAKTPKPAKQAKAAKAPKKAAAPKRKPSDIVRTEANPAKSIVPVKFKQAYAEHGGTNGDKVALAVTAAISVKNEDGRTVLSDKLLTELAEANGIDMKRYEGLNMGQRSMNVRNRLRGILKSGKSIKVGKQTFKDADKALAKPETTEGEGAAA